jgi:hypothetical protein
MNTKEFEKKYLDLLTLLQDSEMHARNGQWGTCYTTCKKTCEKAKEYMLDEQKRRQPCDLKRNLSNGKIEMGKFFNVPTKIAGTLALPHGRNG